jgi:hypothetical protein
MSPGQELQISYDENSIPVSAKCSFCGEQMPQTRHTSRTQSTLLDGSRLNSVFMQREAICRLGLEIPHLLGEARYSRA